MYDNNECHYRVNVPYPPVRVDGPELIYAGEMLSNIGDVVSEMSDVTRYFYISVVTKQQFRSIATCFHHISIVEMHHLNIFAELACCSGQTRGSGAAGHACAGGHPRLSVTLARYAP